MLKKTILIFLCTLLSLSIYAQQQSSNKKTQQPTKEMIDQAKKNGVSQKQLDEYLKRGERVDTTKYRQMLKEGNFGDYSKGDVDKFLNDKVGGKFLKDTQDTKKKIKEDEEKERKRTLTEREEGMSDKKNTGRELNKGDEYYMDEDTSYNYLKEDTTKVEKPTKNDVFGRDIFSAKNLTFAPSFNIPTPKNYILSASDEVIIDIWGDAKESYNEVISPEGTILVANLGPLHLSGLTIEQAEKLVRDKYSQVIESINSDTPTTFITVTLGRIRSIQVSIMGEVSKPGTYTLPSLSTLFNAMYAAGGVSDIGSLREIQLFRGGKNVATLDVYDFLLRGKHDTNVRLEDNDMIIVSPYKSLISVVGNIKRERKYEMTSNETVEDAINYAGGFRGDAFTDFIKINRTSGGKREMVTVNENDFDGMKIIDGDSVTILKAVETYKNRAVIDGAVWRAGEYAITDDVKTVSQLIEKAGGLQPHAFLNRAQIVRFNMENGITSVISLNLNDIKEGKESDVALEPHDDIYIFSIYELQDEKTVTITGEIRYGGRFIYDEQMTLEDLIERAGGLTEAASIVNVEVSRRIKSPSSTEYTSIRSKVFTMDMNESLADSGEMSSFKLEPFDNIIIRRSPSYNEQKLITVEGEVLFGGEYAMSTRITRLSDLIKKAGGVTPEAYVVGARLERQMTEEEQDQIKMITRINTNKQDSVKKEELVTKTSYYVGIDLQKALNDPTSFDDIILREGDKLIVPQYVSTVSINGAVRYPNVVTYNTNLKIKQYVEEAGGYMSHAKKKGIYVVYMNGKVARGKNAKIRPGCEIIVPIKAKGSGQGLQALTFGMSMLNSTISSAALVTSLLK